MSSFGRNAPDDQSWVQQGLRFWGLQPSWLPFTKTGEEFRHLMVTGKGKEKREIKCFIFLPWISLLILRGFFWGSTCWLHGVKPDLLPISGPDCHADVMSVMTKSPWSVMGTPTETGSQGIVCCQHSPNLHTSKGWAAKVFRKTFLPQLRQIQDWLPGFLSLSLFYHWL